jgi:hypothetical protein
MIDAGTQLRLLHCCFEQVAAGFIDRTKFADFSRAHPKGRLRTIGVGLEGCAFEPLPLNGTSRLDPFADLGAEFAGRRDWLLSFSNTQRVQVAHAALRKAIV